MLTAQYDLIYQESGDIIFAQAFRDPDRLFIPRKGETIMKKLIALILVCFIAVACVSLAGCGEEDNAPTASGEPAAQTEAKSAELTPLSLTTINGTAWSISYPSDFTFDGEGKVDGGMGQKNEKKRGVIKGDFTVAIFDGEVYPNAYENVAALTAQFKKNDIYEEKTIGGAPSYICQNGDYHLRVIIGYTDTNYICLDFITDSGDYKALYNSDKFKSMIDSVTISGAVEKTPISSDGGYLTVTPVGAWYLGESKSNNAPTLYNDSIGAVSWAIFDDSQLTTVDKLKEHILAGYSSYSFEEKTIGSNTYEVLDAGKVVYLVAPTSTGKGLEIELRNVTLEEANELLETVEIN